MVNGMLIEINKDQIRDCIACLGFVAHDLEDVSLAETQHRRRAQKYKLLIYHLQKEMDKGGRR